MRSTATDPEAVQLTPTSKPLRVAIIGTGFIGNVHARAAQLAGAEIAAVAASTPERSREAAARFGAAQHLTGPEDLANDDGIDVVHVCTPNHLHAPYTRAALEAGKHVLCEKPLSVDATSAAEVSRLAATLGLVATVPFVYRYYPAVRHAQAEARSGSLGDIRLIHGSYLQDWMSRTSDWSWRVDPDVNGPSRAFADIGSHWCDLVEFTTGHRITRLIASFGTAIPRRRLPKNDAQYGAEQAQMHDVQTEDSSILMFETDLGAHGTVTISQVSPGRKNRLWFEVDGSERSAVFDQELPESIWFGGRDENTTITRGSSRMDSEAMRLSELPPGHPQGYRDCFDAYVRDTYAAIGGATPDGLPTFDDGLRSARIVDAAITSSEANEWVEVAP